jgi:4-amino-4-deoxy-L-arabinose transferase-like glycosyltransferase
VIAKPSGLKEAGNFSEDGARLSWCLIIFGIGLLSRTFFIIFSSFTSGDQRDYTSIAHNILNSGQFAITPASPTIFRPPMYPFFLALIYRLFGEHNEAVWIAQALIGAAAGVILYLILRRFVSEGNARFTAALAAIYPNLSFYAATVLAETLLSAGIVLMVYFVYRARGERQLLFSILAGATAALTILISPRLMGAPLIVAASLWFGQSKAQRRIKPVLLSLCAALLVLTPWTVRNYATFGIFNLASMQGPGLPFWLTTKRVEVYDWKWVELRRTEPLMQRYDELHNDEASEQRLIKERASIERAMLWDGVKVIWADPFGYVKDRAYKYPRLWFQPAAYAGNFQKPFASQNMRLSQMIEERAIIPATARILSLIIFTLIPTVLVICGIIILLPRWKEHAVVYMLLAWVALVQAPLFIEYRFTVVIHPVLAIFSAVALEKCLALMRNRRLKPSVKS